MDTEGFLTHPWTDGNTSLDGQNCNLIVKFFPFPLPRTVVNSPFHYCLIKSLFFDSGRPKWQARTKMKRKTFKAIDASGVF